LQLQPRTKPMDSKEEDLPARPTSIFGLAKPVDTSEKERQVEERLRLEDEAFKAAGQRSRKSSEEHGMSVPVSPLFQHGNVTILKAPPAAVPENRLPEDSIPPPAPVPEAIPEANPEPPPVEETEKPQQPNEAVSRQPVIVEQNLEKPTAASTPDTMPPSAAGSAAVPEPPRRQSFSYFKLELYGSPSKDKRKHRCDGTLISVV
uniref:Protein lap4 n=1 Tax=Gongylonema pulchrum TaxID=637853 RepID=A0A183D8E9_9BILA